MIANHSACRPGPSGRRIRTRACAATLVVVLATLSPALCPAQSDLVEKLEDLNVRLETDHYLLAGTVTDARLAMYADALEYIHREYEQGFSEVLNDQRKQARTSGSSAKRGSRSTSRGTPKPSRRAGQDADQEPRTLGQEDEQDRFPVIVFNNKQQYLEFGRAFLGGSEHTSGMYIHSAKLLLILDQGNFEDTYEVLFHEAFHQFMRRYIKNPPVWINEGLATHYGYARPAGGGLTFRRPPPLRWQLTRKLIEKKQAIALWEVVSAGPSTFYSKMPVKVRKFENVTRSSIYYSEAYTLVHMLLSDRTGRERLREYLRALADDDGKNAAKITREYFGPETCDHMASFWIKHVNSRPETR